MKETKEHKEHSTEKNDKNITITIQTGRGSDSHSFPKQTKISEVIEWAVNKFGYPGDDSYAIVRATTNEELDPHRPLISYHIEDNEVLILSATGSGVWQ